MIKFGVTTRARAEKILPCESAHKGWWPFAFTLLEDVEDSYTEADEPLVERLYRGLSAGEGVWKITKANRFCELDERVGEELDRRFDADQALVVHDMAVSNGVTSLEWYDRLASTRDVVFHASDYFDRLMLVTLPRSNWTVVFDVENRPLQCVSRRFVITCERDELLRHPINRQIQRYLRSKVVPQAVQQLSAANEVTEGDDGMTLATGIRQVSLFHPRCRQLASSGAGFHLSQHNVFVPNPHECHVVRVMNALTPHHFSDEQIGEAVRCSIANLRVGGLYIVGRTIDEEDGRTSATVYIRTEDGLSPLWDTYEGTEIKTLIAAISQPSHLHAD